MDDRARSAAAGAGCASWALRGSISGRFADVVREHPARVAIREGGRALTYAELGEWIGSERVAALLGEETGGEA
jgi:hypothetical protein